MATNVANYSRITFKINGAADPTDYGYSETYYAAAGLNDDVAAALGAEGAEYRAAMLAAGGEIEQVNIGEYANPNYVLNCLDSPVASTYSALTVAPANGTLTMGSTAFTYQSSSEIQVGDPASSLRFLMKGESRRKVVRHLHGIPDFWYNGGALRDVPDDFVWHYSPATANPDASPVAALYWENVKRFLTWVKKNCKLITKQTVPSLRAATPFIMSDCTGFNFTGIKAVPVGAPFGLLRGRRRVGS